MTTKVDALGGGNHHVINYRDGNVHMSILANDNIGSVAMNELPSLTSPHNLPAFWMFMLCTE